ncbi:MAG TPA: tetratricopeptide repeat protein, partial [Acetobacteraceae bacterium]|nr:tetratricopeptide repeat protein [Acetobacteraceae bacterium]
MLGFDRPRLPLRSTLLLVLAASGCAGSGGQPAGVATAAHQAEIEAAMGNPSAAVALLGRKAEQAPSDAALQFRYARALASSGRSEEAIAAAQAARARGQPSRPLDLLIGRLQIQTGDGTGAEQTFQRLAADYPADAEALNGLGLARVLRDDLSGAETAFRQAAARAPGDIVCRNNLGLVLALEGRDDLAVPMLERLRQEAPGSRRVRHNLALAYAAAGQTDAAQTLLQADLPESEAAEMARAYA